MKYLIEFVAEYIINKTLGINNKKISYGKNKKK